MIAGPVDSTLRRGFSTLVATGVLLVFSAVARAEDSGVGQAAREYAKQHDFHGTILVERQGATIYRENFGLADREFDVPVQDDTKFRVASITKAFTAVLVLQLRDEGRLDLDAPFKTYLPGYPGGGADAITIHQLLNHTSGLSNYDSLLPYEEAEKQGLELYQRPHTTDQILERLARGKVAGEPGKKFDYNNHDYVILGKVIEALNGKPFDVVLKERILNPLGMADTGMLRRLAITKKLARTYWRPKGSQEPTNDWPMYYENWYAAGSMFSTAADLQKFADALYGGKLLKPDSLARMLKPGLDDYGYGVWITAREVAGKPDRVVDRFGSILGANSLLSHAMDADITVILLSNTNMTDLGDFAAHLIRTAAPAKR